VWAWLSKQDKEWTPVAKDMGEDSLQNQSPPSLFRSTPETLDEGEAKEKRGWEWRKRRQERR
jgi:hypothetical protein